MALWQVVGGKEKGIVVRTGQDLKSAELPRLKQDAVVEEIDLVGQRLHFKKVSGEGPDEGWASLKLAGNDLLSPYEEPGSKLEVGPIDVAARCGEEWTRLPEWTFIGMEALEREGQMGKGKIYDMNFPWSHDTLMKLGPEWLTQAFQAAKSIPEGVKVTKIKNVKPYIGGGACSKLVFDVDYNAKGEGLHTELFAKIPFPYNDPQTKSDRMAQSVQIYQGCERGEINMSRLLESKYPFKIPKYYFGDFSNDTTNWILITERIAFSSFSKKKLKPYEIEPAYEKMMDWNLRGEPEEYYIALLHTGAKMAAYHKINKYADAGTIEYVFGNTAGALQGMQASSFDDGWTGLQLSEFKMKLRMGKEFIGTVAKNLFPDEQTSPEFLEMYGRILCKCNAYKTEASWLACRDNDYCSFAHGNLNVDNVYFWRNDEEKLEVGVLDLNGSVGSLGTMLWWWLYGCEPDYLSANIDKLLQIFIDVFKAEGGPALDLKTLKLHFVLGAMDQAVGLLGAIPQIYKMCKKKEFADIKDRFDKRISDNIAGKNTLRLYVGGFTMMTRLIHDWKLEAVVDEFVETFTKESGKPLKSFKVD